MEFNRLISLVFGFVVLILIFVWASNHFQSKKDNTQTIQVATTLSPSPTTKKEKNRWNPLAFLLSKKSPTPYISNTPGDTSTNLATTPITTQLSATPPQVRIIQSRGESDNTSPYNAKQIPETGLPTLIVPLSLAILAGGMYIKKRV